MPRKQREHTIVLKVGEHEFRVIQQACRVHEAMTIDRAGGSPAHPLPQICNFYLQMIRFTLWSHAGNSTGGISGTAMDAVFAELSKK